MDNNNNNKITIVLGNDHAAYSSKLIVKKYLNENNYNVIDVGCDDDTIKVDYPDYASKAVSEVLKGESSNDNNDNIFGILLCGTGIGISISANKHKGIRCALCHNSFEARLTREHNNANVLALGGRMLGQEAIIDIVKTFLGTPFSKEERHQKRIDKITEIENKNFK